MSGPSTHRIARPRIDPAHVPFERTETYRRFGIQVDPDPLAPEHLYTKALIHEQGFDRLPHVVAAANLDRYVSRGEPELFRGLSEARYADQLRWGDLFVGRGAFGGGIHAAGGADGHRHAAEYAQDPDGAIVRMVLKAGARVVDARPLEEEMRATRFAPATRGGRREAARAARWVMTQRLSVYATYLGYEGLVDPATGVWLVLNRTALRVQHEDHNSL